MRYWMLPGLIRCSEWRWPGTGSAGVELPDAELLSHAFISDDFKHLKDELNHD